MPAADAIGKSSTMLLVRGAIVLMMDQAGTVIRDGAVPIEGNRIRAVGPGVELARQPGISQILGGSG
jgi:cytosine/adenosine deaminase-related metal-dependent hydrolase